MHICMKKRPTLVGWQWGRVRLHFVVGSNELWHIITAEAGGGMGGSGTWLEKRLDVLIMQPM